MPLANPTTAASVSLEVDGGKPELTEGEAQFNALVLARTKRNEQLAWRRSWAIFLGPIFLGGMMGGAFGIAVNNTSHVGALIKQVNDLESKVDALQNTSAHTHDKVHSLQDTAAITDGLVVTQSAVPPTGYTFGGSLNAGAGEWAPAVHLPEERSDLQAVACGGVIVVLGGINASSDVQNTAWAFDPVAEVTGPPTRTLAPALAPTLTLAPTLFSQPS